jgi:hypothetical protein
MRGDKEKLIKPQSKIYITRKASKKIRNEPK